MTRHTKVLAPVFSRLPARVQFELRRLKFARQIRMGTFSSPEPEINLVADCLGDGDWAIDVGANVGHYTCTMARYVGASGRVLAFEPIPTSFALLAANVRASGVRNVTLFNVALSSEASVSAMSIPRYEETGICNYYQARISNEGDFPVLCMKLDAIPILGKVALVKIDVEGHDLQVLIGMETLLSKDRPLLIVEGSLSGPVAAWLAERRYRLRKDAGSPNIVAEPEELQHDALRKNYVAAGC